MSPEYEEKPPREKVILKSTGAIGDAVILTAVQRSLAGHGYDVGLGSKTFTLSLWDGLDHVFSVGDSPEARVVDVSGYLSQFPHTTDFTPQEGRGHLSQWMARAVGGQMGIELTASPDQVRILLSTQEIAQGAEMLRMVSAEYDRKPIVLIAPSSNTGNRNLSVRQVEEVANGLREVAVACLLGPAPDRYMKLGLPVVEHQGLRETGALLLAADGVVAVDSGPLHLAAAAIQGNPNADKARPEKMVVVAGSSDPRVVAYRGNQTVVPKGVECGIAPCGAHGYDVLPVYAERFGRNFFPKASGKDKSGCVLPGYSKMETAACMAAVSTNEIVQKVKRQMGG